MRFTNGELPLGKMTLVKLQLSTANYRSVTLCLSSPPDDSEPIAFSGSHDRMPLILDHASLEPWLDPDLTDRETIRQVVRHLKAELIEH